MNTKVCSKCNEEKTIECFSFRNKAKKTYRAECKECKRAYNHKYREDNKERLIKKDRDYYKNNKEQCSERMKQYRENNKDKLIKYDRKRYYENREEKLAQKKEYHSRPEVKARIRAYEKRRRAENPDIKLKQDIKTRIRLAIKNNQKAGHTLELLGCSIDQFKEWLEYQFDPYMNWANQGTYWHMDHIKPCDSFDLTKKEEQYECFNWKNIQPMYGPDNISKSNTYNNKIKLCAAIKLGAYEFQKNKLQKELEKLGDGYFIWEGEILFDDFY